MEQPPATTVADLLERARLGDPQGRERLFAACRSYLRLVASTQVEGWLQSKLDASDLVQQTLLEAHRDFDRFAGGTTAEWLGWLRKIMSHNAADLVRRYRGTAKRQARLEVPLAGPGDDSVERAGADPAAPGETPSQEFLLRDTELRVAGALEQLSDEHRQVVVLRNLQRLPFDEVAKQMGRTRPAAQMLWMRAIKKLQEALAE